MASKAKTIFTKTHPSGGHILKCVTTGVKVDWPSLSTKMTTVKHESAWGIVSHTRIMNPCEDTGVDYRHEEFIYIKGQ
jgi:hypothetical protein